MFNILALPSVTIFLFRDYVQIPRRSDDDQCCKEFILIHEKLDIMSKIAIFK